MSQTQYFRSVVTTVVKNAVLSEVISEGNIIDVDLNNLD